MNNGKTLEELYKTEKPLERALSYSRISDFDRNGPKALIKDFKESNYGMTIGSVTDDLTIPKEDFNFDDHYIISDYEKPTATLGKLVDIILDNYTEVPDYDTVLQIVKTNQFWSSTVKEEVLRSKFDIDQFWKYIEIHIQANKKDIISTTDYTKAKELSDILLLHDFSKNIINTNLQSINQYKIKFEYKGIIFRGIIDRINIDHENRTVQFVDLKTGKNSALEFVNSFVKFRYYLQEAIYMLASESILKDLKLKDYKVLPFQFLYIGRSEKIPLLYTVSEKWHKAALEGFNINQYDYRGLYELLDTIRWHFENNSFEMDKTIYESNGVVEIKDNFIEIKN